MTKSMGRLELSAPAALTTDYRTRRSVALMASVFAVFLAILAGLAVVGINLQSSVRAYVGGEGLWSKAQKDAVFDLDAYTRHIDTIFARLQSIAVKEEPVHV